MQIEFRLLHKKVMLHQKNSIFVQLSNYALHLCAFYCSIYIFESASATDFIKEKKKISWHFRISLMEEKGIL